MLRLFLFEHKLIDYTKQVWELFSNPPKNNCIKNQPNLVKDILIR